MLGYQKELYTIKYSRFSRSLVKISTNIVICG